jgi:GNAT superfamily N-acetyltransferase
MAEIIFRQLVTTDHEQFASLRLLGLSNWQNATPEQTLAPLRESEGESDNFILGAFIDSKLVGLIGFKREARDSVKHKGTFWGFYVHEDYQSTGIGKELLQNAILCAKKIIGIRYARAVITITSNTAIELSEQLGFKKYGVEEEGIADDINYYDQFFMKINLL